MGNDQVLHNIYMEFTKQSVDYITSLAIYLNIYCEIRMNVECRVGAINFKTKLVKLS